MTAKKPMMKTIWVHLRSGHTVKIRARNFNAKMTNGQITSYSWDGEPIRTGWFWRRRAMHINPGEIVAIEVRGG